MWKVLLIALCIQLPLICADSSKVNVTNDVPTPRDTNHTNQTNQTELQLPNAEKLIRYRRHPPYGWRSIPKRNKQRRRVKPAKPKLKFGPPPVPSYTHSAPSPGYYHPPSLPSHLEEPSFSIEDFQQLKFDGTDFQIPATSYEATSMDLNLYSHEDEENDVYGAHKFPSLEYNFPDSGSSHESSPPSLASFEHHTPHQKYGVPPVHQSIDHGSYDVSDHYGAPPAMKTPSTKYGPPPATKYGPPPATKYGPPPPIKYAPPPAPPSTHYGVPSPPSYTHTGSLPAPDSYSIYEQKIPNAGYHQNFAEPPHRAPPVQSSHNYEISYSPPAYEISTSYQANQPQHEHKYQPPATSHDGHFAEPPAAPAHPPYTPHQTVQHATQKPHSYYPPETHSTDSYAPPERLPPNSYDPPKPHSPSSYAPPATHSSNNYAPPENHPSNSYAPPETHPSNSYTLPETHPSNSYAPPETHPSNSYAPPEEPHLPSSYAPPASHPPSNSYAAPDPQPPAQNYPHENYVLPMEELPLNQNHKFPSFEYPKSSYEVPIYDPIPFESSNREEQESYPPIVPDNGNSNELTTDAHAAGSSKSHSKSRKRKRRPSASAGAAAGIIPKKHTLDVPELQEAYDADSHVHVRGTDLDTAAHGSRYVEQTRNYFGSPTTTPAPWSPMRNTASSAAFLPTILTSTPATTLTRYRGTSRYHSRYSSPSTEAPSTAVTIQKSRSQSYYDGTIPPPTYQQQYTAQTGRGTRPTRRPLGRGDALALQPGTERNPTQKRTTKGYFDTTLFKSPQSDREMERQLNVLRQNLPKNHKLY